MNNLSRFGNMIGNFRKYWHQQITNHHDTNFTIILVLIFFVFSLLGIVNHEIWRDEAQAWLIARDSSSIKELFNNLRYEGHPLLWYLCLYLITRFTHNPIFMQLFHGLISTIYIFLFVQYSPFTRLQKFLFTFGYFSFFEYNIVSRNYGIGLLLVFLICILFNKERTFLPICLLIGLLFNTNAYGFMIAFSFLIILFFKFFNKALAQKRKTNTDLEASSKSLYIIGLFIVLVGMITALYLLIPPSNAKFISDVKQVTFSNVPITYIIDLERLINTILLIGKVYLRLPNFLVEFLPFELSKFVFLIFSCFLFLLMSILIKKPLFLLFYLFSNLSILVFTYARFFGSTRHHGHLFVILIVCLWLEAAYDKKRILNFSSFSNSKNRISIQKYKSFVLTTLLCIHICSGIFAFNMDLIRPFSGSKETSNFIQKQGLNKLTTVVYPNYYGSTIAAYLNKQIYYLEEARFGSFVKWNERRNLNNQERDDIVAQLSQKYPILLVLNKKLSTIEMIKLQALPIFSSSKSISSEDYHLYIINSDLVEFIAKD